MKHRFFEYCFWKQGFWFRIKGYGLHVKLAKDHQRIYNGFVYPYRSENKGYGLHVKLAKDHQPLFSERYGYTKPLYILGLRIEILRPFINDQP